jgi:MerR family transcriptional regulator, light-induced transcriptional regulator
MAAHGEFSMDQCGAPRTVVEDPRIGRAARSQPIFNLETRFLRSRLEDLVEGAIGPRLVFLHHDATAPSPDKRPTREEVEQLANLAIGSDETAAIAHFETVRAQQHSFATLLAYFVAPAAQHLIDLWKQDLCDLLDVTIGEGRLQTIMDRFASTEGTSIPDLRRRAVLIAPPGETQVFGVKVVEKYLEAVTGWDVTFVRARRPEDAAAAVAGEWVGVVGLTVSAVTRLEIVAKTIANVRSSSRNRHVGVMVGGKAAQSPLLAAQLGADAAWVDAPSAALLATQLLMRQFLTGL